MPLSSEMKSVEHKVAFKRDHTVSVVRDWHTKIVKDRNGTRHLVGSQETKDSKHRKASVVDLGHKPAFLLFLRPLLAETKGVIEVKDKVHLITEELSTGVLARF